MQQFIQKLIIEKKYFICTGLLSILLMLPEIILAYDIKHFLVMMYTLVLLFLLSLVSKIVYSITAMYLSIVNLIIIHIAIHWGYAYADLGPRFAVAMDSPRSETIGYLSTFLDYRDFFNIVYFIIILYLILKYIQQCNFYIKILKIFSFLASVLLIYLAFPYIKEREPYNIIPKFISVSKGNTYVEQRKLFLKSLSKDKIHNKSLIYDKVIFILGESVNKQHMRIYGYDANTTPFLSKLKNNNSLSLFNAIAPSNQTRFSVPIYMTEANVKHFYSSFITSSSLIRDFRLNGYRTLWLSAQGKVGHKNDFIAACASDADQSIFINNFYNTWAKKDIEIVKYLKNHSLKKDKYMFVLHLTGSHVKYSNRYDKNIVLYPHPKNIIEEYDNTIYYTDYVIQDIFKTLVDNNEKVLLIYVSDHGEVVNVTKNGHGFSYPNKDEYDVPFIIYSNIDNKRIDELKKLNSKHYFNMENLYSYISYISGIKDDINLSINSDVIAVDPKYLYNYDELKYYSKEK